MFLDQDKTYVQRYINNIDNNQRLTKQMNEIQFYR